MPVEEASRIDKGGERNEPVMVARCRCGVANAANRKFCGQCGQSLWQVCHLCGASSASAEQFCGACGVDIIDGPGEQIRAFEHALAEAQGLVDAYRYDHAFELLRPIPHFKDPRFADHVRRANEMMSWSANQRLRMLEEARLAEIEGKSLLAQSAYAEAAARLEGIPEPLRSRQAQDLLKEARAVFEERQSLDAEIRAHGKGPLSGALLAHVGRLLTLEPEHRIARRIADKFIDRLIAAAEERLVAGRYEDLAKVFQQIPASLMTDEVRAFRDLGMGLAWMAWDLSHAPVIDAALVSLARRFRELAPHEVELCRQCEEIERRPHTDPRIAAAPWIAAPEETPLGVAIDWSTGLEAMEIDEALDPAVLLANPGRFAVACGLGLQGLGLGEIDTNLLPDETPLWQKLAKAAVRGKAKSVWGLDFSSSGLKAIRLDRDPKDPDRIFVRACDLVEHRKILSQAGSDEEQKTLIDETLRTFAERNDLSADRVCLGLPSRMLLLQQITVPAADKKKLAAVVGFEAARAFPYSMKELVWQHHVLDRTEETAEGPGKCRVAVMATKRMLLTDRLSRFRDAGLRVDIVQSDCMALHNLVAFARKKAQPEDAANGDSPVAVLDIGADSTMFLVSSPRTLWFQTVGLGGDRVNKHLVRQFRLTFAQAEQWKRDPAASSNMGQLFEAFQACFEDYHADIESALKSFHRDYPGEKVRQVFALGGGFQLHGLFGYLLHGR